MARLSIDIDPSGAKRGAAVVKRELNGITREARKTDKAMDGVHGRSKALGGGLSKVGLAAGAASVSMVALTTVALGFAAAAVAGFSGAKKLDAALGEASTLIAGTTAEMELMRDEAYKMSNQFGGSTTQQVEAFYQAISAGAGSVADAAAQLDVANRLAVGGVSNTATAVDVLSTAVNAYAGTGLTAEQVSDTLFTGVKFGKTTIDELASSLGQVVPIAAQMGVGFDEVVGATAALTKNGLSTSMAITGLRGILSGVIRPTQEAADAAERLGIEFNSAQLEAVGLPAFLDDIRIKTGGNSDEMAKLFGSVEALGAVLALTANDGKPLTDSMIAQASAAGAADAAYEKIAALLNTRLTVAIQKAWNIFEKLGTLLLRVVVPVLEGLVRVFEAVYDKAAKLADLIGKAGSWFRDLITNSDEARKQQELLDLAMDNVVLSADAELRAIATLNTDLQIAQQVSVQIANQKLVQAQAHYETAKAVMAENRALAMGTDAYQSALGQYQGAVMQRQSISQRPDVGGDALRNLAAIEEQELSAVAALNLMSEMMDNVFDEDVSNAVKTAAENIKLLKDAIAKAENGMVQLGGTTMPIEEAEQLTRAIAGAGAAATETADTITNGVSSAIQTMMDKWADANAAAWATAETIANGIAGTIGSGLTSIVDGTKKAKDAFRDMARDIIAQLYDVLVVQQLVGSFKVGGGSANTGFAGLLGNLISGATGGAPITAEANGDAFSGGNVIPFATGGIVDKPTMFPMAKGMGLMGEAGPEAIMPLSRGPDGKLGVKAAGGGGSTEVVQHITINAMGDGDIDRVLAKRMPQLKQMTLAAVRDERKRGAM